MVDPLGLDGIAQGAYQYWEAIGVSGASQGGVRGTAQMAGAALLQTSIDFFLARWIEEQAGLSGYAYGQGCYGEALKRGSYAVAGMAFSAGVIGYVVPKIPGLPKLLAKINGLFPRAARGVRPGIDALKEAIEKAKPVGDRLETTLDDGTKVIFRKEVHPIRPNYPEPVPHYNIELQRPIPGRPGRFEQVGNTHIILNAAGNVVEVVP